MRRAAALFCASLALAAPAAARAAAPVFCDTFEKPNEAAWGNQSGAWTFAGNGYYAAAPSDSPLTYTDLRGFPLLTDFAVTVSVSKVLDSGVWLRSAFNGSPSGVLLVIGGAPTGFSGLYWLVVMNGVAGPPQNAVTLPGFGGHPARLRITVNGNTYAAYVDGQRTPATMLTEDSFPNGSAGLFDFAVAPAGTFTRFCLLPG